MKVNGKQMLNMKLSLLCTNQQPKSFHDTKSPNRHMIQITEIMDLQPIIFRMATSIGVNFPFDAEN